MRNEEKKGIKSYKDERHPLPWEVFLKLSSLYYDSSCIHKPLYISLCLPLLEGISWFGTLKPSLWSFCPKVSSLPFLPWSLLCQEEWEVLLFPPGSVLGCLARRFWLGLANDDRMAGRLKCIRKREIRIFLLLSHYGNISPTMSLLCDSSFHGLLPSPGISCLYIATLVLQPSNDSCCW